KVMQKAVSAPPKPGFLGGINIPMPNLGLDLTKPVEFPEGTTLGACAGRLAADAAGPALGYGKADARRGAELRFLALDLHHLVIQVRDSRPDKAKPASWVGADHLEIWTLKESGINYIPDPAKVAQLGVGLDGTTYAGVGQPPDPKIWRWLGRDEQGRP